MIEVLATGARASVQDLGRTGYTAWGITGSGAADRGSLRLANRLVGNVENAAAIEVLLGGIVLRFERAAVLAITGAPCQVWVDGAPGRSDGPMAVAAGAVVRFSVASRRVWTYIAVRGGLATEVALGSRAFDERSGLGQLLAVGDRLPVGHEALGPPNTDVAPLPAWPDGPVRLDAVLGPRQDWFTADSVADFLAVEYVVGAASDRIGTRLDGPPLRRTDDRELLSEPTIRGAIEVPPDGRPIIFGADHPSTCGYPVVAVLEPSSADVVAQCRPGQAVSIRRVRSRVQLY